MTQELNHLRLAAEMTLQTSERDLGNSLIFVVQEIIRGAKARMFCIDKTSGEAALIACHDDTGTIDEISAKKAVLESSMTTEPVAKLPGKHAVYRVEISQDDKRFLYVETAETGNPINDEIIKILLTIYGSNTSLLRRSERDALTGLLSRDSFDKKLAKSIIDARAPIDERRAHDSRTNTYLALIDVDHFKGVNDNLGHLKGDELLAMTSKILKNCFRSDDQIFRYGGEEFAVLIKADSLHQAMTVAARFKDEYASHEFNGIGKKTVSIGITKIVGDDTESSAIDRADKSLYYAKNSGRNRVFAHEYLVERGVFKPVTRSKGGGKMARKDTTNISSL